MSITEIIPAVRALSRSERFRIAQMLLEDLAGEELPAAFKEGHVFPIYTPEYAPNAASQLAQALLEEGTSSLRTRTSEVLETSEVLVRKLYHYPIAPCLDWKLPEVLE